jgi:hypothetical protein
MKNILVFITLALLNFCAHAKTFFFVMPYDKTEDFQKQIYTNLIDQTKRLGIGDTVVFIDGENSRIICSYNLEVEIDENSFDELESLEECDRNHLYKLIWSKSGNRNFIDIVEAVKLVEEHHIVKQNDEVFLFGYPFYQSHFMDFKKGVPSLGHIGIESKGISPFTIADKSLHKGIALVHMLVPSDTDKLYFNSQYYGKERHKSYISAFWASYFDALSFRVSTMGFAENGIALNYKPVTADSFYSDSKRAVYFINFQTIDEDQSKVKIARQQALKLQKVEDEKQRKLLKEEEKRKSILQQKLAELQHQKKINEITKLKDVERKRQKTRVRLQAEKQNLQRLQKLQRSGSEILVKEKSASGTRKKYQYELSELRVLDELILKEFDGDDNGKNKIKVVLIDYKGQSHVVSELTPSGNAVIADHKININVKEPIRSVAIYPVNKNGEKDNLGGVWQIVLLEVKFDSVL